MAEEHTPLPSNRAREAYNEALRPAEHSRSTGPVPYVAAPTPTRNKETSRKKVIILLAIGIAVSFGILLSQSSFVGCF